MLCYWTLSNTRNTWHIWSYCILLSKKCSSNGCCHKTITQKRLVNKQHLGSRPATMMLGSDQPKPSTLTQYIIHDVTSDILFLRRNQDLHRHCGPIVLDQETGSQVQEVGRLHTTDVKKSSETVLLQLIISTVSDKKAKYLFVSSPLLNSTMFGFGTDFAMSPKSLYGNKSLEGFWALLTFFKNTQLLFFNHL